ncbi:hypothetical protein ADK94_27180 [Streptomyces sp. XY593]|uniref:RICIN domain-containing protein n=1 Tax=Streptomyces sp. XY593 TaxID=1519483 RepID=UPI0006AE2345|nr:ricin-type beta-trefoil lectin domain protein [Streptomyces sp. XY593]KOU81270.1 hypothetical protein ADK94_27180 [Streptomyces sp. XY593]
MTNKPLRTEIIINRAIGSLASVASALVLSVAAAPFAQAAPTATPMKNVASGKCLDGSLSQGVRLITCNGTSYQSWSYNGYSLVHAASGMCLDGSLSQGVRLVACNGSGYQNWSWDTYDYVTHEGTQKCLDGSLSQGVRLNACNETAYQRWS